VLVTVAEEFRSTVAQLRSAESVDEELSPTLWARACVAVLPVAGAGLSLMRDQRDLRVPLGASDEMAADAERLQTSLGEGPCLAATPQLEPLAVEVTEMANRWPLFTGELSRRTSFRSIVSVPVVWGIPARRVGALDLYLTDSRPPASLAADAAEVVEVITEMLTASPSTVQRGGSAMPTWMSGERASRRLNVWLAVGMLIAHAGLSSADALAMLRAYAYRAGDSLDDVAAHLTERQLEPAAVLTGA
jgi:hypothetical protein